jgi:hypothetical protein
MDLFSRVNAINIASFRNFEAIGLSRETSTDTLYTNSNNWRQNYYYPQQVRTMLCRCIYHHDDHHDDFIVRNEMDERNMHLLIMLPADIDLRIIDKLSSKVIFITV